MKRVDRWKRRIEKSPHGVWLLGLASYLESIIVPIPLEVVLIPFLLARRDEIWKIATVVTVGCLLGALTGYGAGYFLIDRLADTLIGPLGWEQDMQSFRSAFRDHGFWAIVAIGVVPIPFQVAMLVAGAAAYPLGLFLLASVLARGLRYYGLAALVRAFGDRAVRLWEEHATGVMLGIGGICALLVALSFLRA